MMVAAPTLTNGAAGLPKNRYALWVMRYARSPRGSALIA